MTITYRSLKGSPLTSDEIDTNFKELETRLKQLEGHPTSEAKLSLPLYEKEKLPTHEARGQLALLIGQEENDLVYFDGQKWNKIVKGDLP